MYYLFQFVGVFIIFFLINYIVWYITEKDKVPEFLQYKPWICRLCATLWTLVAIYVALGISFKLWVVLIAGCILAIMNALAMWVNQQNHTISIEEYNKLK